ncbi:enoyl-CoA hydratase/isomerase family protein [Mycobacterium sp. WUMAC-067]|nr:enoyl-CoA hydratase/isomerase family protein [Mycobacterium sp. WUMAC-067]MCA2315983.1 enoyl-CoA hydratase/isomerase family protein [Mycobacterium sp. WUMAC-025]
MTHVAGDIAPRTVLVERPSKRYAVVRLNNPARLNALSMDLVATLHDTLDQLATDPTCRVIVLTGAGRGFCSGLDLSEPPVAPTAHHRSGSGAALRTQEFVAAVIPKMMRLPQPIIAAINGHAFGGGLALAAACDLRLASTGATFCTQTIRLGISGCDVGMSYTLPRAVGGTRAAELMYTARTFDAYDALKMGFVTELAADDQLMERAEVLADTLVSHSPLALEMTKQVLRANENAPSIDAAVALENRTQVLAGSDGDFVEALASRAEKRKPHWLTDDDGSAGS